VIGMAQALKRAFLDHDVSPAEEVLLPPR